MYLDLKINKNLDKKLKMNGLKNEKSEPTYFRV